MLWTIAIILIVLWAIGLVSAYTLGGFIHLLLLLAIIVIIILRRSGLWSCDEPTAAWRRHVRRCATRRN